MEAEFILKKATTEQLEFLMSIKEHHQYKAFKELIQGLIDYNRDYIFDCDAKTPEHLAMLREFKRGEVRAFGVFNLMVQHAPTEIKKRKEAKY